MRRMTGGYMVWVGAGYAPDFPGRSHAEALWFLEKDAEHIQSMWAKVGRSPAPVFDPWLALSSGLTPLEVLAVIEGLGAGAGVEGEEEEERIASWLSGLIMGSRQADFEKLAYFFRVQKAVRGAALASQSAWPPGPFEIEASRRIRAMLEAAALAEAIEGSRIARFEPAASRLGSLRL